MRLRSLSQFFQPIPVDDGHDELAGLTDIRHLFDLANSVCELRTGGVKTLSCDGDLGVTSSRDCQVAWRCPAVAAGITVRQTEGFSVR